MGDRATVVVVGRNELVWDFGDSSAGAPRYPMGYGASVAVDPFPGYAHGAELVRELVERMAEIFAPGAPTVVHVADFEPIARTNGSAHKTYVPENERTPARPFDSHIFVAGKRVPPHPATTRYLVAHEWGHQVEYWLEHGRGQEDGAVIAEYTALRGLREVRCGGGRWHESPQEVFACDFRVLVAAVESEFWPHRGIPRPETLERIRFWWEEKVAWWRSRPPVGDSLALAS